jgi:CubicO group peptidase (beta-lactamase class C family)
LALAACDDVGAGAALDLAVVGDAAVGDATVDDAAVGDAAVGDAAVQDSVRAAIEALAEAQPAVGLVVGVITPDQRWVVPVGALRVGGPAVTADTIFELGSLTKVWTGYLLALAELESPGLRDATIGQTLGHEPMFEGQAISLLDLATHTSGLPNYPPNLMDPDPVNPTAGYDHAALDRLLSRIELRARPGEGFLYSNLGAGVLGEILVQRAQAADYEALVQGALSARLGLLDTFVVGSEAQTARLAQGYREGVERPRVQIGGPLQGAGALRSTVEDQLRFFAGALGDDPAWVAVRTPLRPSGLGLDGHAGLLINIDQGRAPWLYSKSGQTPGFASQVAWTMDPPVLVVILSNASELNLLPVAAQIIEAVTNPAP